MKKNFLMMIWVSSFLNGTEEFMKLRNSIKHIRKLYDSYNEEVGNGTNDVFLTPILTEEKNIALINMVNECCHLVSKMDLVWQKKFGVGDPQFFQKSIEEKTTSTSNERDRLARILYALNIGMKALDT